MRRAATILMTLAGLGSAGPGLAGSAQAQTPAPRFELLPIANPPPPMMFDPAPLSGTMLAPLSDAAPAAAAATADTVPVEADAAEQAPAGSAAPNPPAGKPAPKEPVQAAVETAPEISQEPDPEPAPEAIPQAKPAPKPTPKPAVATSGTVTVIVEGVESSKGIVNVALCNTGLSEEGCPYTRSTAASAGFVEARFADVPPGVYAVVGYHDVNNNDEFDKMFGVPREPYALSNKAGDKLVPTFSDAALNISKGENTVIIRLQRLMGG